MLLPTSTKVTVGLHFYFLKKPNILVSYIWEQVIDQIMNRTWSRNMYIAFFCYMVLYLNLNFIHNT